jgi:hypothetical protein
MGSWPPETMSIRFIDHVARRGWRSKTRFRQMVHALEL